MAKVTSTIKFKLSSDLLYNYIAYFWKMYQLILSLFSLIFAALNLYVLDADKNSYSSESTEEAYEAAPKTKNSSSSKKKKPKRNRSAFIIFSSEVLSPYFLDP